MRALFYHRGEDWSGPARAFDVAARGLVARGWEVSFVCTPDSAVQRHVAHGAYEVFAPPRSGGWITQSRRLRRLLLDRFVEAVFVHTEREHLIVAAAQRFAGRGAAVRRISAGAKLSLGLRGRLALRLATGGFLFTTREDLEAGGAAARQALDPVVAELGVAVGTADAVERQPDPAPGNARTIVCITDRCSRLRVAVALRTVALLAPRHRGLRMLLLGHGSDDADHRMHAAALGITAIVRHLGVPADPLRAMREADLGWVAAEQDDLGFGCLDLMALRTPVLAERDTLAQHYVADGIAGTLLPHRDAAATAALIAGYLAREEQRRAMGNAGRTRVAREFTDAAMVDAFEQAALAARDRLRWRYA
ncbi:MAG TPA: glycosyltransferase [Gemmatimonadaceae bacterium]|nr:glycosyltransferase [Gemmatimonadaceae bacterium]